jgi:hypothetical protein
MKKPTKREALDSISKMVWGIAHKEYWRFPKNLFQVEDLYQMGMLEASKLYDKWNFDTHKFTTIRSSIWGRIVSAARRYKHEDQFHKNLESNKVSKEIASFDPEIECSSTLSEALDNVVGELPPRMADAVWGKFKLKNMSCEVYQEKWGVTHTVYYRDWKNAKKKISTEHRELLNFLCD